MTDFGHYAHASRLPRLTIFLQTFDPGLTTLFVSSAKLGHENKKSNLVGPLGHGCTSERPFRRWFRTGWLDHSRMGHVHICSGRRRQIAVVASAEDIGIAGLCL